MKRRVLDHGLRKRWLLAATALFLALGLAFAASARPGDGRGGPGCGKDRGPGFEAAIDQLELDTETQSQVDGIFDEARSERRRIRRELRGAREIMGELLRSREASEAELVAQAERLSALELELHKQRIATHLQLRGVLSDEEMERLAAALPERPQHAQRSRSRFRN